MTSRNDRRKGAFVDQTPDVDEAKHSRGSRGAPEERGFTLVELLIVIVILPLVVGAIAMGLVAVFSLQTKTTQRLAGSGDLQVVTATFVKDIQGAVSITNVSGATQVCGTTGVQLLGLTMRGGSVSYVSVPLNNGGTQYALERLQCSLNSANPTVPNVTIISSDLAGTQSPPLICDLTWTCNANSAITSARQIAAVKFAMNVPMSSVPYMMVATPRAGYGNVNPPTKKVLSSPLTLLGSDCSGLLTVGGGQNSTLSINVGTGFGNGTLGLANCPASSVTLANGGSILASGVVSGVSGTGAIKTGANPGKYPTTVYADTSLHNYDPYYPMPAVPQPTNPETCPETAKNSNVYVCVPGAYGATSFSNKANITFEPGAYSFSGNFYLPDGSTTTFGTGTYSFNAATSKAFNTGTSGISVFGTDVLLYASAGSMTFGNNASINIGDSAPGTTTAISAYQGVNIWDAASYDTTTSTGLGVVTLGNNSSQTNSYGGIYVPNGLVVDSNNGTISTNFIVAGSAVFSNGLQININQP